jgi:hypothetical protein
MRRLFLVFALVAAALAAPTPSSSQDEPPVFEGICPFPITATFEGQVARTTLPSGVTIYTGKAMTTVTDVLTGKSVTLNISGPVFDLGNGTTTYRGVSLIGGAGFLYRTSGPVVFEEGELVSLGSHQIDVCALLTDP